MKIEVNGHEQFLHCVDPDMPVLWAVRDAGSKGKQLGAW
jgi:hypothetical protein